MQAHAQMLNGSGMHAAAEAENELPLVRVDLSLSAKQITAVFAVLVSAVGALGTAGWLVLPAKQTDLEQVRIVVQHLQGEFQEMQKVTMQLTGAVNDLVTSVNQLREAPVKVIEKRTQIIKPAPAGKPAGAAR